MNVLKLDPRKLANQTDNVDINVGVCEHFLGKLHGYIEAALNNNLFLGIECINMWHRGFSVEGAALYVIRSAITEAYRNNLDEGAISDEVYEPLVNEFKSRLVSIPDWCDYYNITFWLYYFSYRIYSYRFRMCSYLSINYSGGTCKIW